MFEIDRGFIQTLKELFREDIQNGDCRLVEGDGNKTLFQQQEMPDMVIGNLPYNVGSGMIARLLTSGFHTLPMVFTLQKEVVERICATPGSPRYGSFSVLAQYAMTCKNSGTISPGSFYPAPEVSSAILSMTPGNDPLAGRGLAVLDGVLRILFHNRRKTLANNIKNMGDERRIIPRPETGQQADPASIRITPELLRSALEETDAGLKARADSLGMDDFRSIVAYILLHSSPD